MNSIPFDTIVGLIGLIIGFATFAVGIYRNRKQLTVQVSSHVRLIQEWHLRDKLQISYEGENLKDVHISTIKVSNTGLQPIKREEIEKPITISFGEHSQVVFVDVSDASPTSLKIQTTVDKGVIVIEPCLLNRQDSFSLTALTSNSSLFPSSIDIDARIVGIRSLRRKPTSPFVPRLKFLLYSAGMFVLTFLILKIASEPIAVMQADHRGWSIVGWTLIVLYLGSFTSLVVAMILFMFTEFPTYRD